ncbi:dTDP-4-dehydrorhamnose 3,5-epimerase [Campylobacter hyointestinalis]|uniref:dTDP-4-dehydrorhamnose 3,5-epimerase n=1 Tax=Campylobacter hyointestinalis TaxID=198 RepID=UPI000DCC3541|nr:dTDP-4-dehydrorhamnose 3,5-epimerase [Campylobacter hyointestinalis]RAZ58765.1 dTDP-4-dehydrorhamnose 3,5-epimerase [Campylobacter hyointestinalis subsp. lawsonii]
MKFTRLSIPDIILIEPNIHQDNRGYFLESFRLDKLSEFIGYNINFVQDNESKSNFGVFRGLHYQKPPFAQAKLIRVVSGSIYDIVVDIRKNSPNFGRYLKMKLDGISKNILFIPKGFAHGFLTLEDNTIISYKADNYYSLNHDSGIAYNDPQIGIDLEFDKNKLVLSDKDKAQPMLSDINSPFDF